MRPTPHAVDRRVRDAFSSEYWGPKPFFWMDTLIRGFCSFSVIHPGENWLRAYKPEDTEQEASLEKAEGPAQIMNVAARLGDAHGDEGTALKILENGLARFSEAPAIDRAKAFLYRAELALRTKNGNLARSSLALARSLELTDIERDLIADEYIHATALVGKLAP
jgi:hypothetical protein